MELPLAALERILKKAGAKRIAPGATREYAKMLEEHVGSIAREASLLAQHADRNTVLEQDVTLAIKRKR